MPDEVKLYEFLEGTIRLISLQNDTEKVQI